jgi:hypothetical protein
MGGIAFFGGLVLIPFFGAATAGYTLVNWRLGCAAASITAVVPNALIFAVTQQADAITRAASVTLLPVLTGFSLFLAYLGYLAGRGLSGR